MACNTCGHTMQGIVTEERYKVFWCPRCGGLKRITKNYGDEFIEEDQTIWGKNIRDAARLSEIKDDVAMECVPVSADFDVIYQNMKNEKSVSIEMIKVERNYR